MTTDFSLSASPIMGGQSMNLQAHFEAMVGQFQIDPRFCIPRQANDLYDAEGTRTPVVLLGTTQFSQLFITEAGKLVDIVAVVDDFKAKDNNLFHGVPVITSAAFLELARAKPLVSINGCRYDYSRRYFKNLTLPHGIPMLNFEQGMRWLSINPCSDHRIDDWGPYIAANAARFIALSNRLDDDYSKFTLFCVLLTQLTCDPEWILNAAKPYLTLYFRSGLWTPRSNERFADCGASIAESAKAFIDATNGKFQKIWMIEPDEINQKTIASFITEYERNCSIVGSGSIQLLNYALGDQNTDMPFLHSGGHGGHLLTSASDNAMCRNVAVRRLDDILDDTPTLIKMDIEGAELATLKGASSHITQGKPKMAISAYHRSSDLLDLTDFVETLRSDYKIGIRHHTEERWDTCLYFY